METNLGVGRVIGGVVSAPETRVAIEDQLRRVWNPDVRPITDEAWRCYSVGAYRAAIDMIWIAIATDLIDKIVRLADDGDGAAQAIRTQIDAARKAGLGGGEKTMLMVESSLLKSALGLELVDAEAARDLRRLQEDRHLCSHPSLKGFGEVYEPRAEQVRAHLAAALDCVLLHPPTQGRLVLERFRVSMGDPAYTDSPEYLADVFFDRVRPAGRRQIAGLAAKHALLGLEVTIPPGTEVVADRMATVLEVFARRDYDLVVDTLASLMDRFQHLSGVEALGGLARLGDQAAFWDSVDSGSLARLAALIETTPIVDVWEVLPPPWTALLNLTGVPAAVEALPVLRVRFDALPGVAKASVMAFAVRPTLVRAIPDLPRTAGAWRNAERITRDALIPYAPHMTAATLEEVLDAWASNDQCRQASQMPYLAVTLLEATSRLGADGRVAWGAFLDCVTGLEEVGSPYCYGQVRRRLLEPQGDA